MQSPCPKTLSILEITNQRDLDICRKIYDHSFRIGDNAPGWRVEYAQEFNMTTDSKHFKLREWWEGQGYRPDVFGRWVNDKGDIALPLYEGRMIGQFDFSQKGYVSGRGRSAVWRELAFDSKTIEPQYLVSESTFLNWDSRIPGVRLGYMSIGSSTNSRTGVACVLPELPFGNSVSLLSVSHGDLVKTLYASGVIASFAYDFGLRARVGGINLNWFILEESAIARSVHDERFWKVITHTARLTFLHRRFAPEWLRLKHLIPSLGSAEWKRLWAVTAADRLRLWLELDAIAADLYGLDPNDFDWIVVDNPEDPKGFHRVDKHLPFPERLTGLAAAAFRALKEGKWSAESAADLSNDEFFDLLGIPELTNVEAAKAKGLTGPLILKRDGCQQWKPENFPEDDPRYGWTWDHCWQDAIALLGSEEAVQEYIEGKPNTTEEESESTGPKDLFGDPIPQISKQTKLF